MRDTVVVLKSGEKLVGPLWTWRPAEGWFELAGEERMVIRLEDVASAKTVSIDRVEDVDLLQRAKEQGWQP